MPPNGSQKTPDGIRFETKLCIASITDTLDPKYRIFHAVRKIRISFSAVAAKRVFLCRFTLLVIVGKYKSRQKGCQGESVFIRISFWLLRLDEHLSPHFPVQPSQENINRDKKDVKDNRKSLMVGKNAAKAAETLKKRLKSAGFLPGQREDHEKYLAPVSVAIKSS